MQRPDLPWSRLSISLAPLFLGVSDAVGNGRPDHPIQHGNTQQCEHYRSDVSVHGT
jgi:hypothetical protein